MLLLRRYQRTESAWSPRPRPELARSSSGNPQKANDLQIEIDLIVPQILCSLDNWRLWKRKEVDVSYQLTDPLQNRNKWYDDHFANPYQECPKAATLISHQVGRETASIPQDCHAVTKWPRKNRFQHGPFLPPANLPSPPWIPRGVDSGMNWPFVDAWVLSVWALQRFGYYQQSCQLDASVAQGVRKHPLQHAESRWR